MQAPWSSRPDSPLVSGQSPATPGECFAAHFVESHSAALRSAEVDLRSARRTAWTSRARSSRHGWTRLRVQMIARVPKPQSRTIRHSVLRLPSDRVFPLFLEQPDHREKARTCSEVIWFPPA